MTQNPAPFAAASSGTGSAKTGTATITITRKMMKKIILSRDILRNNVICQKLCSEHY